MGLAIGQVLSLAVGVALSPLPIIAVILMLVSKGARVNGPAFVAGWLLGLAIIGAIVLLIAGPASASAGSRRRGSACSSCWWGSHCCCWPSASGAVAPRPTRSRQHPNGLGAIEAFTPAKALGAGALLAGANPKNALLAIAAAASIAATGISSGQQAVAYTIFAIIGTIDVGAPVAIYFAMGVRAGPLLDRLKHWMQHNNAVIMAVLLLVIGAKLVGDALGSLAL